MSKAPEGARPFGRLDYVKIAVLGFALSGLWNSLHIIVLPVRLLGLVPEAQKNADLGLLTFTGLVLAMVLQPVIGVISDRTTSAWGRRRPYILIGAIAIALFLPGIAFISSFAALFAVYLLMQAGSNTAQSAFQGFIPDLVPEGRKGVAAAVKGLLETLGTLTVFGLSGRLMSGYLAGRTSALLTALLVMGAILLAATIATIALVKERPYVGPRVALWPALRQTFNVDLKSKPDFTAFMLSRMLVFMALVTLQTFTLYYLKDAIGILDPAAATVDLFIVTGIGTVVTAYPAGRLSDRIGRRPILVVSGLLGALGTLFMLFATTYGYVRIGGAILGIAVGAFYSTNWALATDLVTKGEEARYLALANLASAGGSALARLIGPLIDFLNTYGAGLGYRFMLGACVAYFLGGSLLITRIRSGQPK